jgi:HAD superfamily hydrolase (TIGR01549 family)
MSKHSLRNNTRVVSFDVDGTLVDGKFTTLVWEETIPRLYSHKENVDLETAKKYVWGEYSKIGQERLEWYDIRYWLQHFGLNHDWRELLERHRDDVHLYPEVPSVLRKLKDHYVLVIVTNGAKEFADIQTRGIRSYFTSVFSATTDFGVLKHSTHLYEKICDKLGISPRELTHVGDHRKFDYLVPRKLGVNAFLLDRTRKSSSSHIVKDLEDFCNQVDKKASHGTASDA